MEYKPSFADQLDVDYICHHGIKGMHWGVRRFQNPDGTLTSAGKARQYKKDYKDASKLLIKASKSGEINKSFTNRDKVYNKMFEEGMASKPIKEYLDYDNMLYSYIKQQAKEQGIDPGKVVISSNDPVGKELKTRQEAAMEEGKRIANKHIDEYAAALLTDISYKNTDGSRDAARDLLRKTGYENILWQ